MVSFELGKEITKDVFRLVTSVGQRKNSESLCSARCRVFVAQARFRRRTSAEQNQI